MAVDLNKRLVSLAEVKNILKKAEEEREGEFIYEQRIAYDHALAFANIPATKAKKLIKELQAVEGIDEFYAYKIADILPTTIEDVQAIFAKSRTAPNDLKQVVDIVGNYYVR